MDVCRSDDSKIICLSEHLTDFSLIIFKDPTDYDPYGAKSILSKVLGGLSVICFLILLCNAADCHGNLSYSWPNFLYSKVVFLKFNRFIL